MLQNYIVTYNHQNRIGVLVEIQTVGDCTFQCAEIQDFSINIRLHIAATSPSSVEELLGQPFIVDEAVTVGEKIASIQESLKTNLKIGRFVRWDATSKAPSDSGDDEGPAPPYSAQLKIVS